MTAQFCEEIKSHWIVRTKCVNFMVCDLYLYKSALKNVYAQP